MRPLPIYAFSAALVALVATLLSWQFSNLLDRAMDVYAVAFLPIVLAILISGNAHDPSEFGLYLGVFFDWLIICLVVAAVLWGINRKRTKVATLTARC